jgi:hypothetical protein
MNQAASPDKSVLWDIRERGEDSNLDCHQRLCLGCHLKKQLNVKVSLYTTLQILSVLFFLRKLNYYK